MVCIGVAVVLPVAAAVVVPIVAAALVVQAASVVGAAVLEAAEVAADATLKVVGDWGAAVERQDNAQLTAEQYLTEWHMAAADAVSLNSSIRVLNERAKALGVTVSLPGALQLDNRNLADIGRWVLDTMPRIATARAALADAAAKPEWSRLVAALPVSAASRSDVTQALQRFQATLTQRRAVHAATASTAFDAVAEAERIVARLDPDVTGADREAVLAGAGRVAAQTDPGIARSYLLALRRKVNQANPKATTRRQAAGWLQALEHPVVARAQNTPEGLDRVRRALHAAIGTGELDPESQKRLPALLNWAAAVARLHYRRDLVAQQLRARGYTVTEATDTSTTARLRVERGDWRGETVAEVWLDADGAVNGQIIRESGAGDEAARQDQDRREELGEHLADVAHELSHQGIEGLVATTRRTQYGHDAGTAHQDAGLVTIHTPRTHRPAGPSARG